MTIAGLRRLSAVAGALLVAQAIILAVILSLAPTRMLLPITLGLPGTLSPVVLTTLDVGTGVIALCLLVALSRLVVLLPALSSRYSAEVQDNRHTARWIEFAFSSSITVFLVAGLNGIRDVGALVLCYAITSGATLFFVVQERSPSSGRMLPLWFAAATGIVPWGVVAFHQVAGLVVGAPPSTLARVITLTMLTFAFAFFLSQWREQRRRDSVQSAVAGERTHVLISLASTSVFAWLVVLGVVGVGSVRL
ncbi:heliorhodopsin HeR [Lacisediminihabitans sp. FW035]